MSTLNSDDELNHRTESDQPFLEPKFDSIPDSLKTQPWAVWKAEPREGQPGKFNKAPRSPKTGIKIGANKPDLFGKFEEAQAAYERGGYTGIGVLLTGNGIIGIDIDDIRQTIKARPEVRQWIVTAIEAGTYCETSPSGKGLHLFMLGSMKVGGCKSGSLEIYFNERFLTVTGHQITLKNGGE